MVEFGIIGGRYAVTHGMVFLIRTLLLTPPIKGRVDVRDFEFQQDNRTSLTVAGAVRATVVVAR